MFKKMTIAIAIMFCMVSVASASLTTIGTATYNGSDYNLIYDDDNGDGCSVIWFDYTKSAAYQGVQHTWAANLDSELTYNINLAYFVTWETDSWRLPNTRYGGYSNGSEMGSLYYDEFGFTSNGGYSADELNATNFDHLTAGAYWSTGAGGSNAWYFGMGYGYHNTMATWHDLQGIAIRDAQVAAVPIPAAVWLLGPGLLGIGVLRKKFK